MLGYKVKGDDMSMTIKIAILFFILISDVVCGVVVTRKLNEQGRGDMVTIMLPALAISTIVVGVILFVAL